MRHNLIQLRSLLSEGEFFCPMVKGNAYGHGANEVAKVCEELKVSAVGVALYSEAESLRDAGIKLPILVFEPGANFPVEELKPKNMIPVVSSLVDLNKLAGASCRIHLKFNTGMNRLGFRSDEISKIKDFLKANPSIELEGACSHLSHGHDVGLEGGQSEKQIKRFEEIQEQLSDAVKCFHFWNTSGLISSRARKLANKGWGARPGIGIYGAYTGISIDDKSVGKFASDLNFKPVMRLKAKIAQAYKIKEGEIVSYGGIWKAKRETLVAVLSLGYADGFSRHFSNRAKMSWRGQLAPVIGRVCMDYTMLDMTDLASDPDEILGEDVYVFGSSKEAHPLAEESAKVINTIPYELFTSVSPRVPRHFEGA